MPAVLLFLVAAALAQGASPDPVAAGRRVYEQRKCATCHMIDGRGNIRFQLDHVASRLSPSDIRRWLTDTAEMERALPAQPAIRMSEWLKANRKINDADVDALVAYLSSLK
jgi:mono/diheme cytochrome c family protein